MNIKKENTPVLVRRECYVGKCNMHDLFSVYLENNAFWKIGSVCESDMVIYSTDHIWPPKEVSGREYQQMTIQHNNQLIAEMSPLDNAERKYLKAVIKPFRDKVKYIMRVMDDNLEENYILISLNRFSDCITLPNFKRGMMYKSMEEGKKYTLEELGL